MFSSASHVSRGRRAALSVPLDGAAVYGQNPGTMATARKPGRPLKLAKNRRTERLEIRLTPAERRALLAGAGTVELSRWVREVALVKARRVAGGA